MSNSIDNTQDLIYFDDVTARIEELDSLLYDAYEGDAASGYEDGFEAWLHMASDSHDDIDDYHERVEEARELLALRKLAKQCEEYCMSTLIRDDYFVDYVKLMIPENYELPISDKWPYCHITIDYESAADELKQDYTAFDFDGVTYWAAV